MNRRIIRYFEQNKRYDGLGRASLQSGVTFGVARGLNVFVQLASTILLARFLSPHDVGLVAVMTALVGFAPIIIDLGATDASIQKAHITPIEVSALFWINIAIGFALTILLVGGSGFIARVFDEPPLTGIAVLLSTTFVLTAMSTQHYALMRRAMEFRRIAIIDISANIIGSLIAVSMALADWGYWALAAKPVVTAMVTVVGAWISCRWVPGLPRFTSEVPKMVRFGLGVTGFAITDYLARSADRFAIGYFLGTGPLGYFQNAFAVYSNMLSILTEAPHAIAISGLSKLKNDRDELRRTWAKAMALLSFFSTPAFATLAVIANDFVVILLGQKWAPVGPLLCIFAVRGIAQSVERTLGWIHVAIGRTDRWSRWGLFSAACQLLALFVGMPFGLVGVIVAYTVATFALFLPALVYAGRPVGIGATEVLNAVGRQTAAGLFAVAIGLTLQQEFLGGLAPLARMFVSIPICLVAYLAIVVGVLKVSEPLWLALSLLRDFGPRWLVKRT